MPMLLCSICDQQFDTDIQVNARYYPVPECEDCINETRRHETGTPGKAEAKAQATETTRLVRCSDRPILNRLGEF